MIADMGTKPNTPGILLRFLSWATGAQFHPPPTHIHYKLLQMQYFDMPFHEILKASNSNN